jgi:5'-nucleotidase
MLPPVRLLLAFAMLSLASPAHALNILLVNDDGLSPNVLAQYDALVAAGHDVLVSVPCTNQSGKGASISLFAPLTPLTGPCRGDAAPVGAPGVGSVAGKPGFHYVNGTPVMATIYGLDVLAPQRWKRAPDLVLSGPNEGQNLGPIVNSSGTVSNAQYAASVGLSAIAVSADANTTNDESLSVEAAHLVLGLIDVLQRHAREDGLLPVGSTLNVNYPKFTKGQGAALQWALTRQGTYSSVKLSFVPDLSQSSAARTVGVETPYPGLVYTSNTSVPTRQQHDDEAVVNATGKITVTVMQVGFDSGEHAKRALAKELQKLVADCGGTTGHDGCRR